MQFQRRVLDPGLSGCGEIVEYVLTIPYSTEPGNAVPSGVTKTLSDTSSLFEIVFSHDGLTLLAVNAANNLLDEYSLSTAYDISTLSYTGRSFDPSAEDPTPHTIHFNTNGTKMFMIGDDNDTIFEYDVVIPYNMGSANVVYTSNCFFFLVSTGVVVGDPIHAEVRL